MAYVAVTGGEEAIDASLNLVELSQVTNSNLVKPQQIEEHLPELVEQVQSESSFWAPEVAAVALTQAGGSVEEAVFLVRAFRSTLERLYSSCVIDPNDMIVDRRISSAFKDIPGGQILGMTRDYSHRLIEFDLVDRTDEDALRLRSQLQEKLRDLAEDTPHHASLDTNESPGNLNNHTLPKVSDHLRSLGLIAPVNPDDTPPVDITKTPLAFPAPRSVRLQILTRGMTQAVISLGYAAIRGFGMSHPTIGELRHGEVPITIAPPFSPDASEDDTYYLGSIPLCEVESYIEMDANESEKRHVEVEIGYGLVYGGDESKAIAMSVLDHALRTDPLDVKHPPQDEEFVLTHIDGVEATGFISHLKLPHYVTFQSKLDAMRRSLSTSTNTKEGSAHAEEL